MRVCVRLCLCLYMYLYVYMRASFELGQLHSSYPNPNDALIVVSLFAFVCVCDNSSSYEADEITPTVKRQAGIHISKVLNVIPAAGRNDIISWANV